MICVCAGRCVCLFVEARGCQVSFSITPLIPLTSLTESGAKLAAIFLSLSSTALGLQASVRLHSALSVGSVVQTQAFMLIQQGLCPMSHLSSSGSFFFFKAIK